MTRARAETFGVDGLLPEGVHVRVRTNRTIRLATTDPHALFRWLTEMRHATADYLREVEETPHA